LKVKMTTMKRLVITLLLIGGTSAALAQNAPPTNGYHHHRIVIPLTRPYRPYWWPQGQWHLSPSGRLERWGFWCQPAGYHRLSCGVDD
jgi:hypothetical protein